MGKIRLGKTKDSRTRKKKVTQDAEIAVLEKLLNEKEQPIFKQYLLQKGYSLQTIKSFNTQLKRYQSWLKKENVSEEAVSYNDILYYVQSLRNKVKQQTIKSEINAIKHYYNYLIELNIITENPTNNVEIKGIKRKVLHDIFSKQELEKLYNDYRNLKTCTERSRGGESPAKKRNEIILSLLIYQGLNTTELARLTTNNIKLREGKIFINGTRRSNERTLQLEAHQVLDIMEYTLKVRQEILQETANETDLLFISLGKGKNQFSNIISKLLKQLKKLDKKVKNSNQIRTSVITNWLKNYNLRQVQYFAGHRYVSSTEAYQINDLADLQEDIEKYHPIG